MKANLGETYNIPAQSITSVDPYDLEPTINYSVADLMNMSPTDPAPQNENALPSLLKPLMFVGAGLLAYTYFK